MIVYRIPGSDYYHEKSDCNALATRGVATKVEEIDTDKHPNFLHLFRQCKRCGAVRFIRPANERR